METEIKNAVITDAVIDIGDRNILTVWIYLDYGGCGQGFGGYALYLPKSFLHHSREGYAGHYLFRCMEIAGVQKWNEMAGKTIRVKILDGLVKSIGHIVKNDWFDPSDDMSKNK